MIGELDVGRSEIKKILCTFTKYSNSFDIEELHITVRNDGDLPAIIHDGILRIGDEEDDFLVLESIMPGEERTINLSNVRLPYFKFGEYQRTTELYSGDEQLLASYQNTLTVEGGKSTPRVEGSKSIPGYESVFVLAGLLAVAFGLRRRR